MAYLIFNYIILVKNKTMNNPYLSRCLHGTMFEFSKLCKAVETMDSALYGKIIAEKSVRIIDALSAITQSGANGLNIYLNFILCAVAADGRLDEKEYLLLKPLFDKIAGHDASYEDARKIFSDAGLDRPGEYKRVVDEMVDILGIVSQDLKNDIVIVCLMVCGADGKVSSKEKRWIKQLVR